MLGVIQIKQVGPRRSCAILKKGNRGLTCGVFVVHVAFKCKRKLGGTQRETVGRGLICTVLTWLAGDWCERGSDLGERWKIGRAHV